MTARQEFEVVPAGAFALAFPLSVVGVFAFGLSVALFIGIDQPHVLIGALPAFLVVVPVIALVVRGMRRPLVRLEDGVLQCGRLPRVRVPVAGLDLEAARIVDLDREPDLRPTFRLLGTSLPGFKAGWFRLRHGVRAFLIVTARGKVLVLPRRDAGPVLLSVVRPEALLDALRRAR